MAIRRAMAVVVALVVSATFAAAQPAPKQQAPKLSKQEREELERVVKIADNAMAGQPAPTDGGTIAIEPFFFKSTDNMVYVPMVVTITNGPKADALMLLRVVPAGTAFDPKAKKVQYPWEDPHFLTAAHLTGEPVRLHRGFMAAPGKYDVYITLKERLPEKAPRNAVAKTAVSKTTVDVPNFYNAELSTSTMMVVDKVNTLSAPLTQMEMRDRAFAIGVTEIIPVTDMEFQKSEELNVTYQIYNAGLDSASKPNIDHEYVFYVTEGAEEKKFNNTPVQTINASNIPPTYDASRFPLPGGVAVPLKSFPAGNYRLEVKVTDKISGKVLTQNFKFTVKG